MSSGFTSFEQTVHSAWPPDRWKDVNIVVALSGGADSVTLLRALHRLKRELGGAGKLAAAHVDHGLRGETSQADADWCQGLCDQLDVPLTVCTANTLAQAKSQGDGLEAAARTERYRLLTQIAEQGGARYLVTAHTRDDQVETILMRMLRGAGLRGLRGIPRTRVLTPTLTLMRPLLGCSRTKIESYLEELGQKFRTDATNHSPKFTRNRVRHELLPMLRDEFNAEVDTVLLRLAAQAGETQELVEQQARRLLQQCDPQASECDLSLEAAPLANEASLLACEALRIVWREAQLPEQDMTFDWWQRLWQICLEPAVLNLPGNIRAEVGDSRLRLSWKNGMTNEK